MLAKCSVGATQAFHAYKLHLGQLLEEYDLAQRQLEQIETELHLILERIPYAQKLIQIRGVNATSLAGVLGEAGDLSGYALGNALLRHAGLNLAEASSGKRHGKMVLSKRGRPRLRHFLYLMAMCIVMTNPDVRALHHHNVEVKKLKKMKSIMKLCGKFAHMLVGLAKSSEAYNSTKVFPLAHNTCRLHQFMYSQDERSTEYRETLRKRARTCSVRKTDLHPLVRCDEGMKGL